MKFLLGFSGLILEVRVSFNGMTTVIIYKHNRSTCELLIFICNMLNFNSPLKWNVCSWSSHWSQDVGVDWN